MQRFHEALGRAPLPHASVGSPWPQIGALDPSSCHSPSTDGGLLLPGWTQSSKFLGPHVALAMSHAVAALGSVRHPGWAQTLLCCPCVSLLAGPGPLAGPGRHRVAQSGPPLRPVGPRCTGRKGARRSACVFSLPASICPQEGARITRRGGWGLAAPVLLILLPLLPALVPTRPLPAQETRELAGPQATRALPGRSRRLWVIPGRGGWCLGDYGVSAYLSLGPTVLPLPCVPELGGV